MEGGKIPISLGKTCPVKCEFCYEIDHSYRETLDPPKTTDEDWKFILDYISRKPTDPMQFWCLGGNEYMEWTDLFLHPKAMEWVEDFLTSTDKNITFFTVGYVQVPKIHELAARFPGPDQLRAVGDHPERLPPAAHAPRPLDQTSDEGLGWPGRVLGELLCVRPRTRCRRTRKTISKINQKCVLWMGCLTPVRGIKDPTAELMRGGRKYLPEEALRLYEKGLPNIQTIQTEAPITAFMNRRRIVSAFDSLELEKRDTVVMARSVYKVLNMYRKNRAKYLMVPNATLGGDSDCSVLLTFDDIARCVNGHKRIHIPKCMMQSGRGLYTDIGGVTLEQFMRKTGVKATVLHKIDTKFANKLLWRNCLLKNYVEDYVRNPLVQSFESLPVPA